MRSIRPFVPAILFAIGIALTWQVRLQQAAPLEGPLNTVLRTVDGYASRDQIISDAEQRVAGMTNYVARVYIRDSVVAFSTLVSYYDRQTQGRTIHSPRNCLPGAGWEIVSGGTREVIVDGVSRTVNRYVLRNGGRTALAYYWYQGRGRVTANEYRVKWNLLRDAALKGRTEEALVRVIVPIASSATEDPKAEALADQVAPMLMTEVNRVLPGPAPRRS